jgi:large subunit ribosomal protein L25
MEEVVLKASHRAVIGKQVRALRRDGNLPAILYGKKFQPIPVTLNMREANRVLPHVTSSQLVIIELDGEQHHTLVREKQRHPVQGALIHVDFNVVSMTEKLHANVLIHLTGDSSAVKDFNAILVTGLEEIEVECLPKYLPDRIELDISSLINIGDAIHVKEIQLPEQVQILTDPEEIIVVATAPAAEEIEVTGEEVPEPEVIERGKKEEEEF